MHSTEGFDVTAACQFTTAAINSSLNQIGAISPRFPCVVVSGLRWWGHKRKIRSEEEWDHLEKADKKAYEQRSEKLDLRGRSARVTSRTQATGR